MNTQQLFLEKIGAKVEYAGDGKIWSVLNGKDVRSKKYKYVITLNNSRWYSKSLDGFILNMLNNGNIKESDLHNNGHQVCIKCNGKGTIREYAHIDGGLCYNCIGHGIIWDKPMWDEK